MGVPSLRTLAVFYRDFLDLSIFSPAYLFWKVGEAGVAVGVVVGVGVGVVGVGVGLGGFSSCFHSDRERSTALRHSMGTKTTVTLWGDGSGGST